MSYDEAIEWLEGIRSSWNTHCANVYTDGQLDQSLASVRCANEDAAKTEQAYWTVRAYNEGLIDNDTTRTSNCRR